LRRLVRTAAVDDAEEDACAPALPVPVAGESDQSDDEDDDPAEEAEMT
jgi:hypothetical protein